VLVEGPGPIAARNRSGTIELSATRACLHRASLSRGEVMPARQAARLERRPAGWSSEYQAVARRTPQGVSRRTPVRRVAWVVREPHRSRQNRNDHIRAHALEDSCFGRAGARGTRGAVAVPPTTGSSGPCTTPRRHVSSGHGKLRRAVTDLGDALGGAVARRRESGDTRGMARPRSQLTCRHAWLSCCAMRPTSTSARPGTCSKSSTRR